MPDHANVLVKVVVILGVIKRVPATISAKQRFLLLCSCAYRNSLGWLSGLNRASKINVGLEPGLGL